MAKVKWNYAVVKSVFGDLWIGKTRLEANGEYIFSKIEETSEFACQLFEDINPDFDINSGALSPDYDEELVGQLEDLENPIEEDIEEIEKGVEKFIVRS